MTREEIMKKIAILTLIWFLLIPSNPAIALSDLANDFLIQCRQLDIAFPPDDWSDEDLRDAALEVLDNFEANDEYGWAVFSCLTALGHARNPDDIPRMLAYEDSMTDALLRALRGFPAPDAIDCMLRWIDTEKPGLRELSIKAIAEIDFDELDDPDYWLDMVIDELLAARENESVEVFVELIDEIVTELESGLTESE